MGSSPIAAALGWVPALRGRQSTIGLRSIALAASAMVFAASAAPVSAFCDSGDHWSSASGHQVFASSATPAGFSGALNNATKMWNEVTSSKWSFVYFGPTVCCSPVNGGWIPWKAGDATHTSPGWTVSSATQGAASMTWANTYLNTNWTWNADGVMNHGTQHVDVTTVTGHELGHWLRLLHPTQCVGTPTPAEEVAVMTPDYVKKWSLRTDDKAGSAAIY